MTLKVHDYSCNSCGHVTEVFSYSPWPTIPCSRCGGEAVKQLSAPRAKLEGVTGAFPGAAMAWERKREEQIRQEKRREREHGDDGWR